MIRYRDNDWGDVRAITTYPPAKSFTLISLKGTEMTDYPHIPAAFINSIAEEGTKAEAVQYLQKQWNETCAIRKALRELYDIAVQCNEIKPDSRVMRQARAVIAP